ncbi:hypothetical protein M514_23150 [Trichuris suis]|uniref:Uncharacterized protein n=1 Tax=Trichuris suis TaxID=68888 RepID=A0A085N5E6_9BILA|nr:hypothetical protein M514_23150 [Trichuris suis]
MDDAKSAVSTWCNTQPPGFYKERLRRWRHRLQKCLEQQAQYLTSGPYLPMYFNMVAQVGKPLPDIYDYNRVSIRFPPQKGIEALKNYQALGDMSGEHSRCRSSSVSDFYILRQV